MSNLRLKDAKISVSDPQDIDLTASVDHFLKVIRDAVLAESSKLEDVAAEITKTHLRGGTVFTFGAGHAQAFAMELTSRAGGLAFYRSMHLQDFRTKIRDSFWDLRDSAPERVPENGPRLLDHHKVTSNDLVIIASQSGRNGAPIEMALECQRRGITTVGISSRLHTNSVDSRHPSGQKLFEVVTHFIDNGSFFGDAAIELPDGRSICSLSTIGFTLIAQSLNLLVVRNLLLQGKNPPVLISANVDHGDKNNSQFKRETPPDVSN